MTVLHLIDGASGGPRRGMDAEVARRVRDCCAVTRGLRRRQTVAFIGPRSAALAAQNDGLEINARISPPLGNAPGAWLPMRKVLAALGRPGVVVCWGVNAARLAHRAIGEGVPRIAVVPEGESAPDCERFVTYGISAKRRLLEIGVSESRVAVAPPPVALNVRAGEDRLQVRHMLGCGPASTVILSVGAPGRIDAVRFCFLMGLLAVAGIPVTGVIGPHSMNALRAARLSAAEPKLRVIESNRPTSHLLAAADLALFDGGGRGTAASNPPCPWLATEPILTAHVAGVPVVAPAWADADHLFPPDAAADLLAFNSSLPELARKAAALALDGQKRRICAAAVLRHAQQASGRHEFAVRIGEFCDELIEEPTETEAAT